MTRAQQLRAELSEIAHESFDGAMVVKTLGRETEETDRFAAKAHELRDVNIRAGRIRAAFDPTLAAPAQPRRARRARRSASPRVLSGADRRRATWSPSPTCSPSCPSRSARSAGCSASSRAAWSASAGSARCSTRPARCRTATARPPSTAHGARLERRRPRPTPTTPDQPLLDGRRLHRRARPHRRAGRRHRLRQEHADHPADPAGRPRRRARSCSTAPTCATSPRGELADVGRGGAADRVPVRRHRPRQRHARRRRPRRGGLGGAAHRPGRRLRRRPAATASTPSSASAAPRCPAGSGSGSRWPARWSAGRGC